MNEDVIFGYSKRIIVGTEQKLVLPVVGSALDGSNIIRGVSSYFEIHVCKGKVRYCWQTHDGQESELTLIPLGVVSDTDDPPFDVSGLYKGKNSGLLYLVRDSEEGSDAIVKVSFPGYPKEMVQS